MTASRAKVPKTVMARTTSRAMVKPERVQADWKRGTVIARLVRASYTSTLPRSVARTSRAMTNRVLATIPVSPKML
jgi:hypothetical protein